MLSCALSRCARASQGMDDFVTKPIRPEFLRQKLRAFTEGRMKEERRRSVAVSSLAPAAGAKK